MTQKPRRGGRPTNAEMLARRASAAEVLDGVDQQRMWRRFLDSPDDRVALDCWKYLNDRVNGKPAQAVDMNLTGEMNLNHLSEEELDAKLAAFGVVTTPKG